ncbi:unnamed protein product [Pleuronectes platessa]|uniref:Uncharacterized protein n=1 Tax=Pleuronectes platessa TaxID=8262 RepID=A0A9N7YME6_PLEPL|nr:unnamed protein product [Pleuronectes platessa]
MRSEDVIDVDWRDAWGGFGGGGVLTGAWHRLGEGGLQERHVHRKLHCGSLSVAWLHFNGGLIAIMDTGRRGRDERTRSAHGQAHNEQLRARQAFSVSKKSMRMQGKGGNRVQEPPRLWLFTPLVNRPTPSSGGWWQQEDDDDREKQWSPEKLSTGELSQWYDNATFHRQTRSVHAGA